MEEHLDLPFERWFKGKEGYSYDIRIMGGKGNTKIFVEGRKIWDENEQIEKKKKFEEAEKTIKEHHDKGY